MHAPQTQLVRRSDNAKTGPIATTTTTKDACPTSCPMLRDGSCYAEAGYYTRLNWRKVTEGARGLTFDAFVTALSTLPDAAPIRHNVAGDLPGIGDAVDAEALAILSGAMSRLRAFTYTHKPVLGRSKQASANRRAIAAAQAGITINLSADDLHEADAMLALGIGPVCAVVPSNVPTPKATPQGARVVECPAVRRDDVTCATCMLCARGNREYVIAFPAHGTGAGKINRRA